MDYKAVNFEQKPGLFDEHRTPRVIAEINDCQFKIVKIQGSELTAANDVWI